MTHRLVALPLAALAAIALASVALAGGSAEVSITNGPIEPIAGDETRLEMTVLQHGETAVSWPRLTVVARNATSGDVVRAEARAEGPTGSYAATMTFPTAGEWTLTFDSPELEMGGTVSLSVVAPAAVATAPAGLAVDVLPLMLLIVASVAVLVVAGLFVRNGRGARDARVAARN